MSADLASLRIAEERIEWGVTCALLGSDVEHASSREGAFRHASTSDALAPSCGPHRVVSRRVITTDWVEQ